MLITEAILLLITSHRSERDSTERQFNDRTSARYQYQSIDRRQSSLIQHKHSPLAFHHIRIPSLQNTCYCTLKQTVIRNRVSSAVLYDFWNFA